MSDPLPTPVEAMVSKGMMNMGLYAPQVECARAMERTPNVVLAKGRRGGGTYLGAGFLLYDLCFRPDLDALVKPGEVRYSVCVAVNLDQSRRALEAARLIVEGSPMLCSMLEASTSDEIRFRLPGGHRSAFKSQVCSSRGIRGWAVSSVLMDECGFFISADGDANASAVYQAMRPAGAQFGGLGRFILVSNPMGDQGFFAERWKRADEGLLDGWTALKYSTQQLNPTITDEFMRQVEQEDPDTFASEYLAQFEPGGANAFFDMTRVHIDPDLGEAEPGDATSWAAGGDPATSLDGWGFGLVGKRDDGLVLGPVRTFAPDKALRKKRTFERMRAAQDKVLEEVATICKAYNAPVFVDQHLSQAITTRLQEMGLQASTFAMTRERKHACFRELRGHLYSGALTLPNNPMLLDEMTRCRVKIEANGPRIILGRSSQGHSDALQALAVAAYQQRHIGGGEARASGGKRVGHETTFGSTNIRF